MVLLRDRLVETGSFTAVALEQQQSQPTVGRQISALEAHVGVRLMQRTTRALTLTDDGRIYYEHAQAVLDAADAAAMAARPGEGSATRQLRIAAPVAFARLHRLHRARHRGRMALRRPDGAPQVVRVKGRIRVSASEGMRSAVLEGLGVAVAPAWLFTDEVDRGALERVLADYEPAALPIQAVTPSRRLVPRRVRALPDFLAAEFKSGGGP